MSESSDEVTRPMSDEDTVFSVPTGPEDGERQAQPDRSLERTGNPTVDSVLESLERLDHTPVSEHVEVFESAHENLRAALADADNDDRPA